MRVMMATKEQMEERKMRARWKRDALRKIEAAVFLLNDAMSDLELVYKEPGYYVEDSNNFNVMKGPSHSERGEALFNNVIKHFPVRNCSGGGW
jgi:hypothetical protein